LKKILFLAAHRPGRSPGQRFRFEQYLPYLESLGHQCHVSYLLTAEDDQVFYKPGHYLKKFRIFLKARAIRRKDIRAAADYDIVFIYREAIMTGSTRFERQLAKRCKRLILDFDDAIWLQDVSEGNRKLAWLKRPSKTAEIIKLCSLVITGNQYLADYARQYNNNVTVIPTTLETGTFRRTEAPPANGTVCIGWTGSITTLRHLELAVPVMKRLYAIYGNAIAFRVIADREWSMGELPVEFVRWSGERETRDLSPIHIGIMPLPDDQWAKGKCGFKGLQYMAMEIPAVMSPVGVNTGIIEDGVNGFLAASEQEWFDKLNLLIQDAALRERLGRAGRTTVETRYSFEAWKHAWARCFE
jgi:glycosyltransferase involved in cell wall biosynthesis